MNQMQTREVHNPTAKRGETAAVQARILFADNSAVMRYCVAAFLENAGYAVTTVGDGRTALNELRQSQYDLLITDHEMPLMTGAELIAELRHSGSALPVIVVSIDTAPFANGTGGRWKLAAFVQKPFVSEKLLETVGKVLCQPCPVGGKPHPARSEEWLAGEDRLQRVDHAFLVRRPGARRCGCEVSDSALSHDWQK